VEYLKLNRLDYIQVGFFSCVEYSEILKKKTYKKYLDFQKKFPNAVFLFVDSSLNTQNSYPFQCFRFSKTFLSNLDKFDLEEENQKASRSFSSDEILQNLNFKIIEDEYSVFSSLSYADQSKCCMMTEPQKFEQIYFHLEEEKNPNIINNQIDYNLLTRMNEVNRLSENFIEEQKKYINYFKVKRQFGKTKESEFLEMLNKKGNELANLDKIDISLLAKNIITMNSRVKACIDQINLRNSFSVEI
jgi:hypothetical protein